MGQHPTGNIAPQVCPKGSVGRSHWPPDTTDYHARPEASAEEVTRQCRSMENEHHIQEAKPFFPAIPFHYHLLRKISIMLPGKGKTIFKGPRSIFQRTGKPCMNWDHRDNK